MKSKLPRHVTIIYNAPSEKTPYPLAPTTDPDTAAVPYTGFPRSARAAGYNYDEMILALVEAAWKRYR